MGKFEQKKFFSFIKIKQKHLLGVPVDNVSAG